MRRSDELISLVRDYSSKIVSMLGKLIEEAERLKMRSYTRGFDYDFATFESLMDETLNTISAYIDVVHETADVLLDETLPSQIRQGLGQMLEKLDGLFVIARDAVKASSVDREMSESKFDELFSILKELKNKAEEIESASGLLIKLIKKRAEEFDSS